MSATVKRLWRKPATLKSRLQLLSIAGLLPLILFALWEITDSYRRGYDETIAARQNTGRALVQAVDAELGTASSSLQTLALSPSFQDGDLIAVYKHAAEIARNQPSGFSIGLSDAAG